MRSGQGGIPRCWLTLSYESVNRQELLGIGSKSKHAPFIEPRPYENLMVEVNNLSQIYPSIT